MAGVLSGISAYGHNIGVGSSYGAFMAPLGHIAAQGQYAVFGDPYRPMILVCGHVGLKTGEDGPTHADPQALQLLQENFPRGTAVTLTPWDPQEIWPLVATALAHRPARVAPFVTRSSERVLDRAALGLATAEEATTGVYLLRRPRGAGDLTIVLQESAVTYAFLSGALPLLEKAHRPPGLLRGQRGDVRLAAARSAARAFSRGARARGHGHHRVHAAYAVSLRTTRSRPRGALHPYRHRHYLGSGQGEVVLAEAGLNGESQFVAIKKYLDDTVRSGRRAGATISPARNCRT